MWQIDQTEASLRKVRSNDLRTVEPVAAKKIEIETTLGGSAETDLRNLLSRFEAYVVEGEWGQPLNIKY
jgi:hypothetical protein